MPKTEIAIEESASSGRKQFATTRWSVILQAGGPGKTDEALDKLCRAYWPPIYAAVRRAGYCAVEAEDLTQEFFSRLLRYDSFSDVSPSKGRFRSFLLAALKHFLTNQWHREHAQKRGGRVAIFSLESVPGIEREALEPRDHETPERAFDRQWAETLLARVNARLRREYEAAEQGGRFEVLKPYLIGGVGLASYAESASRLGLSESAVKSAIFKMRQRYAEILRSEIAKTVADPDEIDDEIRHLLAGLSA